jgi:SpoVK/Ycf46/Vps4 family AAA+-type ATPase
MNKFVLFLDEYKSKADVDYRDLVNITKVAQIHYKDNNFQNNFYTGLRSPSVVHKPSSLRSIQKHNISPGNLFNFPMDFNNIFLDGLGKPPGALKIYDLSVNFNLPGASVCTPPEKIQKIKKVIIDVSVNNISDILKIINDNEYHSDTEYNIDLEALTKIKEELILLDNMIGMTSFKNSVIDQLLYFLQNLHIGKESDFKHTILCGPPGTGKTEIAKILGKMYSKIGILKNNIFKKVSRSDLIAGYLGQTAIKTKKVINECLGGCLFIDEAYSLANNDNGDSYSKECLDTICESLSDHKDDLMVIIAGYEDALYETFFRANKGLESRFIWRFNIDSYTPKELLLIFLKKVEENEWRINMPENPLVLEKWFDAKKDNFKHFGRDMELLFSYTKISHGRRIYSKPPELRKILTLEDMENGYKLLLSNSKTKGESPVIYGLYV